MDDDNPRRNFHFTNGDLSTGAFVTVSYPWKDDVSLYLSSAFEFNISQDEEMISLDFGLAVSF